MKEKKIKIFAIIITITILLLVLVLTIQLIQIGVAKNTEKNLQQSLSRLETQISDYNAETNYYGNSREAFLEEYAREYLTWGTDTDIWYTNN